MNLLVFDNYDSFTYNLVHLAEKIIGKKVHVSRNDEISIEEAGNYDKILISPGPGLPSEAGILLPLIRKYSSTRSIFGVCLGQQGIGEAFGARLINLDSVYHGVATRVNVVEDHIDRGLFKNLPPSFESGRYHSWVISNEGFPDELEVTARDDSGNIMALKHRVYDVTGVQFHPESVLTPLGEEILKNWLLNEQ